MGSCRNLCTHPCPSPSCGHRDLWLIPGLPRHSSAFRGFLWSCMSMAPSLRPCHLCAHVSLPPHSWQPSHWPSFSHLEMLHFSALRAFTQVALFSTQTTSLPSPFPYWIPLTLWSHLKDHSELPQSEMLFGSICACIRIQCILCAALSSAKHFTLGLIYFPCAFTDLHRAPAGARHCSRHWGCSVERERFLHLGDFWPFNVSLTVWFLSLRGESTHILFSKQAVSGIYKISSTYLLTVWLAFQSYYYTGQMVSKYVLN